MLGYIKKKDVLKIIEEQLAIDRKLYEDAISWQDWMLKQHKSTGKDIDEADYRHHAQRSTIYAEAASQLSDILRKINNL